MGYGNGAGGVKCGSHVGNQLGRLTAPIGIAGATQCYRYDCQINRCVEHLAIQIANNYKGRYANAGENREQINKSTLKPVFRVGEC